MSRTWDSRDIAPPQRYDYWRETLTTAFTPLVPQPLDSRGWQSGAGLYGNVTSDAVGPLNVAHIESCAQQNVHGPREVRQSAEEVWFVNLIIAGRCVGEQEGRECDLRAGSFGIFDARRPFTLSYTSDWNVTSVRVPAGDALALLHESPQPTAVAIDASAGTAAMLATLMTQMSRRAITAGNTAETALSQAFLMLLRLAVPGAASSPHPPTAELNGLLREQICAHVSTAVRQGRVLPETVARHFHISVRKLHQLFEESDLSFSRTVLAARVDGCASDIAGSTGLTLVELAARWGFADVSHMHRSFRQRLGYSPREYRQQFAATP